MILILTRPADPHADRVEQKLGQRGVEAVRFNPAEFPSRAGISLSYSASGRAESTLQVGSRRVDLRAVTATWYRRPEAAVAHAGICDQAVREFVQEECNTLLQDTWNGLSGLAVPGPRHVIRRAQLKASQLGLAAAIGLEIPPTIFTNRPEDFLDFYRAHNGNIVTKQVGPAPIPARDEAFVRYTELVSRRNLGYARAVRYCPVIAQAYVEKRIELRITVVGRRAFAAEIHSQDSNHTRHDWRRYDDFATRYQPHRLPRALEDRCLALVRALGLCFGAIDMVLTPEGRYVFLEINPNGQYLWIEEATGLPISEALCDLLMSGARANTRLEAA